MDNEVVVNDAGGAKRHANDSVCAASDGWITTKVNSTRLYSSNVGGTGIAVTTSRGISTLSGNVDSGAVRALAVELAKNLGGVKRVGSEELFAL